MHYIVTDLPSLTHYAGESSILDFSPIQQRLAQRLFAQTKFRILIYNFVLLVAYGKPHSFYEQYCHGLAALL